MLPAGSKTRGNKMSYKVKLKTFEGPFDLLVHLIENARMNIYDIAIAEITEQYMAYIKEMQKFDVAVGSEFMVLAANLIDIKAKMLLPRLNEEGQAAAEDDPRNQLVEKILEYKRFKQLSQMLSQCEEENLHIYEKPKEDISAYLEQPDEYLSLEIGQFVNAFNLFLSKKKRVEEVRRHYVRIERERESTENRMAFIKNLFKIRDTSTVPFSDLVVNKEDKYDIVLAFTSVLEMSKAREVRADQQKMYGEIMVTKLEEAPDDK